MTFARLSDAYVRREGPPRPRSPYQALQEFQEGGEVSFGEPESGAGGTAYDPYGYLDPWESPVSDALNPNIWDGTQNVWYDPLHGNTYDPNEGFWRSPEGMVYENGVWQWPAQYAAAAGPVPAGYFPQNPSPQMFTGPIGPTTEGTVYSPQLGAWLPPEPSWWEQRINPLVEAGERLGGIAETGARMLTAPAIAPYELARGVSQQLGGSSLPDINPLERGLEAAAIPVTPGNVGREVGRALVPATPAEIALSIPFAVMGTAAGLRAGEAPLRALARGALEGLLFDPTQPGGAARGVEQLLEPTVVRLAADPAALRPLESGLMASRGAMEVIDPAGIRLLAPGELPNTGEVEMFHGTVNGLEGDIRPGLNVTPLLEDAQSFANSTLRAINAGLQEAPNVAPRALGGRTAGEMLREAVAGRLGETGGGVPPGLGGEAFEQAQRRAAEVQAGIDKQIDNYLREQFRPAAGVEPLFAGLSPEEKSISDAFARQLANDLGDIPVPQMAELPTWPELRSAFSPDAWDAWREWKAGLGAEYGPRGRSWVDLIDKIDGARVSWLQEHLPEAQETFHNLNLAALDKLSTEMAEAARLKAARDISEITERVGRQLDPEALRFLDERLGRVEREMALGKQYGWMQMPGGVEPGRAPGPRWSRESADYYGPIRGGRGGGRGMAGLRGGALEPQRNASDFGVLDWINLPRSLIAGMDLSYALRQGSFVAPAHVGEFRRALGDMAQAMGSPENAARLAAQHNEFLGTLRGRGLSLNLAPVTGGRLSEREGAVVTALTERIPVVGKAYELTNRGNATFLNSLRVSLAEDFLKKNGDRFSDRYLQHGLNYIERATGRGSLKFGKVDLEQAQGLLANLFFAPRFTLSIPQRLGYLNPLTGGEAFGPVWRMAVKDNIAWLGTGATILGLAAAVGAQVQLDPRATDFGRIRIGDTRVDIWGGAQPLARAVWQGVTGQKVSETGDLTKLGPGRVALEFIRNRLSPQGQLAAYFGAQAVGQRGLSGVTGERVAEFVRPEYFRQGVFGTGKTWDEAAQFAVPLFIQDVIDGLRHEGLTGGLLGSFSTLGVSPQTYPSSAATQRTLALRDLMKDPEVQALLPEMVRGLDYRQLTGNEKSKVLDVLAQRNPDLVVHFEKETRERFGPSPIQQAAEQRSAIEAWKQQNLSDIQERLGRGEIDPYTARKELQNIRAARNDVVNGREESQGMPPIVGLYQTPEYKQAIASLEKAVAEKRVPNDPLTDLLSARRGTPAGEVARQFGVQRAEAPGRPAPNVGEFGQLMDLIRELPGRLKDAEDRTDWDEVEFVTGTLLSTLQQTDLQLAQRISFNLEREAPHPLEALYFQIQDFYPEYRALLPPEGQRWSSQDFMTWQQWLQTHPAEEAAMFALGYRQEVVTQEAADIVHRMFPGLDVNLRIYGR